jgi:hypothetical protein
MSLVCRVGEEEEKDLWLIIIILNTDYVSDFYAKSSAYTISFNPPDKFVK